MAVFTTILELLGIALVVAGVALIHVPAALIVAGVSLVGVGVALARPATTPAAAPDDAPGVVL